MSFEKFAKAEVLGVKSAPSKVREASLDRFADYSDYRTDDDYLYVRVRAISSRVNKNNDGWPADELKKSYKTFIGKPLFVDHHNSDPKKARGVVVDAQLHREEDVQKVAAHDPYYASAPKEHLPPTWVELLLEVDAKKFPKLAKAIVEGEIDGVSMGANVEWTKCSHCGNVAHTPEEYCTHVRSKGAHFDFTGDDGKKVSKRAYEDCYDFGFFELSFVFDPADETALVSDIKTAQKLALAKAVVAEDAQTTQPEVIDSKDFGQQMISRARVAYRQAISEGGDEPSAWRAAMKALLVHGIKGKEALSMVMAAVEPHAQTVAKTATGGVYDWEGEEDLQADWADPNLEYGEAISQPSEDAKVIEWRAQQFEQLGFSPQVARELAMQTGLDVGEFRRLIQGQPANPRVNLKGYPGGATPDQAQAILTHTDKTADRHNPRPQSEATVAPEDVDTLRQEQICPICGSDMENGVCVVCNYEEPPEGFDMPDLEQAEQVDQQMRQQEEQQAAMGQPDAPTNVALPSQPGGGIGGGPGIPGPLASTTSSETPATVKSEMSAQQHTAAGQDDGRVNTQERPVLPATQQTSDRPSEQRTEADDREAVESSTKDTTTMEEKNKKVADGAQAAGGSDVQPDARVDVEGKGGMATGDPLEGTPHQDVEKETQEHAPHTDTWSGEKGQTSPVQGEPFPDDFSKGSAHEKTADQIGPDPRKPDYRVDVDAELGEGELGDDTQTWTTHTDGPGSGSLDAADPVTNKVDPNIDTGEGHEHQPSGIPSVKAARRHAIKSMKLADLEAALGLLDAADKFDRAAELEEKSEAEIDAQLETLSKVKTAGLAKPKPEKKTAGRLPSMKPVHAAFDPADHGVSDDEIADSRIFIR